jgi:hypothetical protein
MRDDERKDAGFDLVDIEKDLGRLAPVDSPAGLRVRVMDRADRARERAALSPRMRILAVACSIVIVAVLLTGPLIGRHERIRLAALLDGRSAAPAASQATELAEVLVGEDSQAERMVRLRLAAASAARKEQAYQVTEARRWLKGWLEDETSEDPL